MVELRSRGWVSATTDKYSLMLANFAAKSISTPIPEPPRAPNLSGAAQKRMKKKVERFFATRIMDELESYFQELAPEHHFRLVSKLVKTAIESTVADAELVSTCFARVAEKKLCSQASFEDGFISIAKALGCIVIAAPKAFDHMIVMMKGAGFEQDVRVRIAGHSMASSGPKLLALLAG